LALVVSEKCWYKNTLRRNKCHGSRISHPIRFSMKSRWQTSEIDRVGVMVGGTYLGFQEIRCGVDDGRRVHDALAASPRSADAAGNEGEEEEEEGPREGRRVQATDGARRGGRGLVAAGEGGGSRRRRESGGRGGRRGARRHQSGAREGSAQGNRGARVAASRACGLPNGGKSWPEAESHAVGLSRGNSGIPAGFWTPNSQRGP
jgi:hypothetical protein